MFLVITVLATVSLYYELYVGGGVSTLLANLHMSFKFYVAILAFGNLAGAFGSLFTGLSDRVGRANLVALVEGICLVATPALIRDFSPQVEPGHRDGLLDRRPDAGQPDRGRGGQPHHPGGRGRPRFWTH